MLKTSFKLENRSSRRRIKRLQKADTFAYFWMQMECRKLHVIVTRMRVEFTTFKRNSLKAHCSEKKTVQMNFELQNKKWGPARRAKGFCLLPTRTLNP